MTTKTKKQVKTLTIKWISADKGVVKFEEDDNVYNLSDAVKKFHKNTQGGTVVEVSFKDEEVSFMKKVSDAPVETSSKSNNSDVEVWTVKAKTADNRVISFDEGHVKWYQVPAELRKTIDNLGIKAKSKVRVTIGEALNDKKQMKPGVVSIELVDQPRVNNQTSNVSSSNRNNSIERQAVWKTAGVVVASMVEEGLLKTTQDIKTVMEELSSAGANFVKGE